MTEKEYFNNLANNSADVLQQLLDLFHEHKIDYCLVGGLAVNAYVEPVVSLDLDIIVATESLEKFSVSATNNFKIKKFHHSLNLTSKHSDLRIQLQTDPRYQAFLSRSAKRHVMGYDMMVAAPEDVLQGKIWAYSDKERRRSKRQKDLADIFRLVEAYPNLNDLLPDSIKNIGN